MNAIATRTPCWRPSISAAASGDIHMLHVRNCAASAARARRTLGARLCCTSRSPEIRPLIGPSYRPSSGEVTRIPKTRRARRRGQPHRDHIILENLCLLTTPSTAKIIDVSALGIELAYPHASLAVRPARDRQVEPEAAARTRSAELRLATASGRCAPNDMSPRNTSLV